MLALIIPVAMIALLWVLFIVPQQRRVRAHQAFVAALEVGDEVITTAGVFGTITAVDDDTVRLRVADGVELTMARMAIGQPRMVADPEPSDGADPELSATADGPATE